VKSTNDIDLSYVTLTLHGIPEPRPAIGLRPFHQSASEVCASLYTNKQYRANVTWK